MSSSVRASGPSGLAPDPSTSLASRIEGARRAVERVRSGILFCLGAATFLTLCGLMAVVDYFIEVPFFVRAAWLTVAAFATLITSGAMWWTWVRGFQVRDAAAIIEGMRPVLGQRLRTFLDYDDPVAKPSSASPALVTALRRDAQVCATNEDFDRVARQQPLGKSLALLCVVFALWGLGFAAGPECRTAAGRTFLAPWHYTQVEVSPLESTILEGADVNIEINIVGRPIRAGFLRYQPRRRGDGWTIVALHQLNAASQTGVTNANFADNDSNKHDSKNSGGDSNKSDPNKSDVKDSAESDQQAIDFAAQEPLSGKYSFVFEACQESLDFEVHAGPRELPPGSIHVVHPLRVEKFLAHVEPPAYTRLPSGEVEIPQFKVQEGSRVSFELQLNRRVAESSAVILEDAQADSDSAELAGKRELIQLRAEDKSIRGEFLYVRKAITFDVRAGSMDGMRLSPYRVQIRVQPDARPTVRFVKPAEELEVLATAEVPLAIEAGDDLGLHKVGIEVQVAGGMMQTIWEQDYAGDSLKIQNQQLLALEDHEVRFPGSVNYFAFAEDHYFGEPRRSVTPLRFVDIRPFKRAYQLLDNGGT